MSKSIRSPRRFGSYDRKPKEPRPGRWDIQGLRAFAVLAVVADHLTKWPKGGFVGVDVFFVISGFLITGLLVRERQRTGKISFTGFYRRRAKRILPAAVLVLGLTALISHNAFNAVRAKSIDTDALWALGFSANWHFRDIGTDYFTASNAISPLQHYWSLSIEEQFYFVWPWLMLGIFALLATRVSFSTARVVIFGVITVATIASFGWALHETSVNATGAYFSTFSRAWELGLGAMCAVAAPMLHKIPDAIRPVLAWIGLATMTVSLFVVSSDSGFPAPWAALPVFATALVIAAGTHEEKGWQQPFLFPLTNPVSNYVGDVSYSLYLWHFPVIIIGKATLGETTQDLVYLGVIMALLSVFSYHLIEDPVRHSTLFEMTRERRKRHRTAYFPTVSGDQFRYTALAFALCFMFGATALAFNAPDAAVDDRGPTLSSNAVIDTAKPIKLNGKKLDGSVAKEITAGLSSTSWPAVVRDGRLKSIEAPELGRGCFNGFDDYDKSCTYGGTSGRTAVVLGDSVAMSWVPAVRAALPDWNISTFGKFSCPFADVLVSSPNGPRYQKCLDYQAKAIPKIQALKPDIVFASSMDFAVNSLSDKARGQAAEKEWLAGGLRNIAQLSKAGSKVVILRPPPGVTSAADCATNLNSPADCEGEVSEPTRSMGRIFAKMADGSKGTARFIDTIDWFCSADRCPAVVGGTPVRIDSVHMSRPYGQHIAPNLLARLQDMFPKMFLAK